MAFKPFTSKQKREHYTARAKDKSLTKEDRAYAAGQRDARNDEMMGFLLGKNSPLTPAQKAEIKAKRKAYAKERKARKQAANTAK